MTEYTAVDEQDVIVIDPEPDDIPEYPKNDPVPTDGPADEGEPA